MKIVISPWAEAFLSLIASAKTSLRLVAPYYSKEVIEMVLGKSNVSVRKEFILALREQDVLVGVQSAKAIRLLKKTPKCEARIAKRLHAKFLIADEHRAIVTSSNLTHNGLNSNAEVGVYLDEPEAIKSLLAQFKTWFSDSGEISISDLDRLARVEAKSKHQGTGKVYGNKLTIGGKPPKHRENRAASGRDLAGVIQKVVFNEHTGVNQSTYLQDLRNSEPDDRGWGTPSRYKALAGRGGKLLLYEKGKGITAELEIKRVIDSQDEDFPYRNIYEEKPKVFRTPISLEQIRSLSGFENFGKYPKDHNPFRNITRQQYVQLMGGT
jgi:hypothetical protein